MIKLSSVNHVNDKPASTIISEDHVQKALCAFMTQPEGLGIFTREGLRRIGYLSHEFKTSEGTQNHEKLDILGYDLADGSLVAFEIKGPDSKRLELENLFLQGLEHRNWLEENRRAVKLMYEGPRGKRINSKRRVRLILGFFGEYIPPAL